MVRRWGVMFSAWRYRALNISAADKKQAAADEAIRNHVEGKFGQAKRRFSLGRIMAKLAGTSAAQISLSFLVMNLERALRQLFFAMILLRHAWSRQFSPNASPLDKNSSV